MYSTFFEPQTWAFLLSFLVEFKLEKSSQEPRVLFTRTQAIVGVRVTTQFGNFCNNEVE